MFAVMYIEYLAMDSIWNERLLLKNYAIFICFLDWPPYFGNWVNYLRWFMMNISQKKQRVCSSWPGINSRSSLLNQYIWLSKEHPKPSYISMCCPCSNVFHVYLTMYVNWFANNRYTFRFYFHWKEERNIHIFFFFF